MATIDTTSGPPRTSLSDYALEVLRERLATGVLRPGDHLAEPELAEDLQVSRGPIREALLRLQAEGQIEIRRHKGAFVSELTTQDVEEVHTLREAIEQLAAERAAIRLTDAHTTQFDQILEAMKVTSGDVEPQEAVHLDLSFHDLIYEAADHVRLLRTWGSIRSQVSFFLYTRNVNFPDFPTVGFREHKELRDALCSRDPDLARGAAAEHLRGAYTRLSQLDLPPRS